MLTALLIVVTISAHATEGAATETLSDHGCLACHSIDGTQRVGPSLLGAMGRQVEVTREDGTRESVTIDESFVRESIATPNAKVRVGFAPGTMPAFELTEAELQSLISELTALSEPTTVANERRREPPLWPVVLYTALFVLGHLALSSAPLRAPLVAKLGEGRFQGIYSIVAAVGITGMFWEQPRAPHIELWPSYGWMTHIPLIIMPLVMILWIAGFSTPNATTAGQADVLKEAEPARGIAKISRHPANVGFALWALTHIVVNGDVAALIVFGGILVLAIAGTWHIEKRRAALNPEGWARLTAVTSIIPFVAIMQGRNRVTLSEIGYGRIAIALVLYVAFLGHAHELMMGVSVMPW